MRGHYERTSGCASDFISVGVAFGLEVVGPQGSGQDRDLLPHMEMRLGCRFCVRLPPDLPVFQSHNEVALIVEPERGEGGYGHGRGGASQNLHETATPMGWRRGCGGRCDRKWRYGSNRCAGGRYGRVSL